jgi:type I restriction enzyme S subunit
MSNDWTDVRLGDIAQHHKTTINPQRLGATLVDHYSLPAFDDGERPERVEANTVMSNKLVVPPRSILVSRLNPHIPRIWATDVDPATTSMCSTEFAVLTAKNCDGDFLRYFIASDAIYGRLGESVNGTSSSHQRVSLEHLLDMRAPMPPIEEQRRIAAVLSTFDTRIRLNIRVRDLLAEAAHCLLASAPRTCPLSDVAVTERFQWYPQKSDGQTVDHYSLPAYDAREEPERVDASAVASNKLLVRGPRVLFSRLNPDTNRTWLCVPSSDVDASVCSTEYAVLAPTGISSGQLWAALCSGEVGDQLAASTTGTSASHQRVTEAAVLGATIADPRSLTEVERSSIDIYAGAFLEKRRELALLRETRDFLLQQLVSGELRVEAVSELVEVAS